MDLKEIHETINDVWKFTKAHVPVIDTDEYWAGIIADADDVWRRHGKTEFCRGILTCCMRELEKSVNTGK